MRVNIEQKFFNDPRNNLVCRHTCISKELLVGMMGCLWHNTQQLGLVEVSGDELLEYSGAIRNLPTLKQQVTFINMIERAGHIRSSKKKSTVAESIYRIAGNAEQIERQKAFLSKQAENGKKGGLAKARNRSKSYPDASQTVAKPSPITITITNKENIKEKQIAEIWNAHSGNLKKIQQPSKLNSQRKRHIKARLNENSDLDFWKEVFVRMSKAPLCVNGGWATFDWVIKNDANYQKVLEGNYDRDFTQKKNTIPSREEREAENERIMRENGLL